MAPTVTSVALSETQRDLLLEALEARVDVFNRAARAASREADPNDSESNARIVRLLHDAGELEAVVACINAGGSPLAAPPPKRAAGSQDPSGDDPIDEDDPGPIYGLSNTQLDEILNDPADGIHVAG